MSFINLVKKLPAEGKVVLKGGQSQGHVVEPNANICVKRFIPILGKGSEYAAKFRAEEDKAHFETLMTSNLAAARTDVTGPSTEGHSQLFEPEDLTSIGTMPNVLELEREDLTQVYQNYEFKPLLPTEHLEPIYDEREKILQLIELNQVCIIKGPTGCGKSTQVPQFILDSYVKRGAHCNIVVTQPRRIAAITIAQHICKERNWQVGTIVGYQVGLDKSMGDDTRLLYCTTGVLLEKMINKKHMNDFTHIILDEVHERDVDMDLTMLVVKLFLRKNSPNVKVVLMSATMDVSRFAEYYAVLLKERTQPAPFYEIKPINNFNVQVNYLEALKKSDIPLPEIKFSEPGISPEAYTLVPFMIKAFNSIDADEYKQKRCVNEKGAVLIFLPGLQQIETLFEILNAEDAKYPTQFNLWICPLHSSITKDEQEKVRQYAPPGKRKVILSTNIAESSLTIPDVKYVIDYCLTKHLVADPDTGFTSLRMAWASHTNCIQREGRAGRVQDGRVYRMVPRTFYMREMDKECLAEMIRCPLHIVVLKCKKIMEEECPLKILSNALDPPDLSNYEKTILKLKEVGALLTTCKGEYTPLDGDLTFIGQVMSSLPLDIHITKMILLGHIFDVLEETIIMGCAMSVQSIFSERFQKKMEAYNNKLMWADSSESDLIAYLNAYLVWRQLTGMGKFSRSKGSEEMWSRRYMMQIKHLQEVAKQEQDIKNRLRHLNIKVVRQHNQPLWAARQKPLILKLVLSGAFYPHYYIRGAQNPNAELDAVKSVSGQSPYNSVYLQNMPQPIPVYLDHLKEALRTYGIADDFQIFYDSSRKVTVTFNTEKVSTKQTVGERNLQMNIPGEIVMPVYRAIKLRQLNMGISIHTASKKAVEEKMRTLSLTSNTSMSPMVPTDYKPKILLNQQYIEISVVHLASAGNFYAHIHPSYEKVHQVQSILNKRGALVDLKGDIENNVIYAAPYREKEGQPIQYYRAQVVDKVPIDGSLRVEVFFIDFGNTSKMRDSDLREVANEVDDEMLNKIPALALECTLAEVAPSVWSSHEGQWSDEANRFVNSVLFSRHSWCAKVYSFVNDVASIWLFLEDNLGPSGTEACTLNNMLVTRGFARLKDESYFSKMNHAKRVELEEKGDNSSDSCSVDSRDSMIGTQKSLSMTPTPGHLKVNLKGPNSPLEMRLYSLAHSSTHKEVKVDGSSVNSVLLDSDPTDPHDRLLVAGSVTQSPDGRKLSLNHTTVLPNMHGLAALVCLMFAPVVELRTDKWYSRYTGALCGLGAHDSISLFPANDMEITFDVHFTEEDLLNVNKLRYWLNERFCSDYAEDYPEVELITLQKNIKSCTISLLKEVRQSVKVLNNVAQFQWNQVPESRLLLPFPEEVQVDYSNFVYELHKGVKLNVNNDCKFVTELFYQMNKLEDDLKSGTTPKQLRCVLCDMDFDYCQPLRFHMNSTYHMQLAKWLHTRAAAHGLHHKTRHTVS